VLSLDETHTARIGSMVEGQIVSVSAQIGDRVTLGTALAEIHGHIIHEAWADYRKALADRKRRQSELDYTYKQSDAPNGCTPTKPFLSKNYKSHK
jgi:multidrug resistance efflux pump